MKCVFTLAVLLAVVATPAVGQTTGSILGPRRAVVPDGKMSEKDRARISIVRYARCLKSYNPKAVKRALELMPGAAFSSAATRLSTDKCIEGTLRFPAALLRGPLFIASYQLDFGRAAPQLSPTRFDFAETGSAPSDATGLREFAALLAFADCVAHADPAAARSAVLAAPTSAAEKAAYDAVTPHLASCLPGGQRFRFDKLILTGLLAEVLYRNASMEAPVNSAVTR